MTIILKIKTKMDDLIGWIVGGILLIMALAIGMAVVDRIAGGQNAWVDELVRAGVVWTTFLGAYASIAKNKDIKVDILTRLMPPKAKLACEMLSDLFVLLFLYFFVQLSFVYVQQFANYKLPMTGMSRGLLYSIFPVGSVLMIIHYILSFVIKCKSLFFKKRAAANEGGQK